MNTNSEIITIQDIIQYFPKLKGYPRLIKWIMKILKLDLVNHCHAKYSEISGPEFFRCIVEDEFKIKLYLHNDDIIKKLPEGPFITISNHYHGAWDGIILIYLFTRLRPDYKVMVNMILNKLTAMSQNFIAVDAFRRKNIEHQQISIDGIRRSLTHLSQGHPLGFFPAGAMCKINWFGSQVEREWNDAIIRLIRKAKVPIIPVYFHGGQTFLGKLLGKFSWKLRSLRMPAEVFAKRGKTFRISIGDIITVRQQTKFYGTNIEFGDYLRRKTLSLKNK